MASTLRPRRVRASGRWPRRRENNRPLVPGAEQYVGGMMADGTGRLERVSIDWQHPEPVRERAPVGRSWHPPEKRASAKPAPAEPWRVAPATAELPPAVVSQTPARPDRRVRFQERLRRMLRRS